MKIAASLPIGPPDGFQGRGTIGLEGQDPTLAGDILSNVLSTVIGVMTVIAILWFIFLLLIGAFGVMSAGADKNKVAEAQARISNGLIGLIITFSAIAIIMVVGYIFGISDIINIPVLISRLAS